MSDEFVNILMFLPQGFEDLEAVSILDVFGWTQYRDHIKKATVATTGFHQVVQGRFGLRIEPDISFSEVDPQNYQALVLPGGFHSHGFDEAYDKRIHDLAKKIHQNGGYIATMCVGILPIADAGLLKGKKATTYPYSRNHDNIGRLQKGGVQFVDKPVVMDDRIISCKGPAFSIEVAFSLMADLMGSETVKEVKKYLCC